MKNHVLVRFFSTLQEYIPTWESMRYFTHNRTEETTDELWFLEHPPIFTQGQNGKAEHILQKSTIPIIPVDRGGQITYHGPGQLMVYALVNLKRKNLNIRQLVSTLENSIIQLLNQYGIEAIAKKEAPGVYVRNQKICSFGLRIRRGCSYHGLALNVSMDLTPFSYINPCGFSTLTMTQCFDLGVTHPASQIRNELLPYLTTNLGYTTWSLIEIS